MINLITKLLFRFGLFIAVLVVGTITALMIDETESLALTDLSQSSVWAIILSPDQKAIYSNFVDKDRRGRVYRSDDNGQTWQNISLEPGLMFNAFAAHPINDNVLFGGTAGGPLGETNNVWRSDDAGQTWHNFNLSLPASPQRIVPAVTALAVAPNHPEILYVGTAGHGVYRFNEGQIGYELVGGISLYAAHVRTLIATTDSRLYALTNSGLFMNSGAQWQKIDSLPGVPLSVAAAPSNPRCLYASNSLGGAYRSNDGGETWETIGHELKIGGLLLKITTLDVDPDNPNHIVAATAYSLQPTGIYESYSGGQKWVKIGNTKSLAEQLIFNQGIILARTEQGLERLGQTTGQTEAEPRLAKSLDSSDILTRPTGGQLIIMALTIGLSGLALLARPERILWYLSTALLFGAI